MGSEGPDAGPDTAPGGRENPFPQTFVYRSLPSQLLRKTGNGMPLTPKRRPPKPNSQDNEKTFLKENFLAYFAEGLGAS